MEDFEIVDLYFKRDEAAITETDRKYGRLCHSIAAKLLDDGRDIEECLNDSYMGLWKAIPPNRPVSLKAFLSKMVRNLSIKRFEYNTADKRNRDLEVSFEELEYVLADDKINNDFSDDEIAHLISNFLRKESADARNIFVRKYYYFDTVEEIAERYDFSITKIKSSLFHTRKKLKKYLEKEGVRR